MVDSDFRQTRQEALILVPWQFFLPCVYSERFECQCILIYYAYLT